MHRLVLNSFINLLVVVIALTGAINFVLIGYSGLPAWASTIAAVIAVAAVVRNVYLEFIQDFEGWRVERARKEHGLGY